jgi:hypothetical protein
MKKKMLFVIMTFLVMASSAAEAAQRFPINSALGFGNLAMKVDYINFTDDLVKDFDNDEGIYVGFEGYTAIMPNIYLGMEIGYANPEGSIYVQGERFDTEVTYVPIELNLKYAARTAPDIVIGLGAGISTNYIEEEEYAFDFFSAGSREDWLFGGQLFIDMNYTTDLFFAGVNAKYQITEDFKDYSYNYNSWRVGGQVGVVF